MDVKLFLILIKVYGADLLGTGHVLLQLYH